MVNNPKISIIIPIHNGEKYLEKCIHSVLSQTLDDLEFIFINDGSTDQSMSLLETILYKYPNRIPQSQIINLKESQGIAAVRNLGLEKARGEYVGWVDCDDWVDCDMFEKMYQKAKDGNNDIVWIDYYRECEKESKLRKQECTEIPIDCVTSFLECKWELVSSLWSKLALRSLYNSIKFTPGQNMAEDLYASIMLFSHAKRVSYLPEPLYHYRYNSSTSMSATKDKDKLIRGKRELIGNFRQGIEEMERSEHSTYRKQSLEYAKLYIRHMVLKLDGYKAWKKCYPESINYRQLKLSKYQKLNYWFLIHNITWYNSVLTLMRKLIKGNSLR